MFAKTYYSTKDNQLFALSHINAADNVVKLTNRLLRCAISLADMANQPINHVETWPVMDSSKYRYQTVFAAKTMEAPRNAVIIDNYTMEEWLRR